MNDQEWKSNHESSKFFGWYVKCEVRVGGGGGWGEGGEISTFVQIKDIFSSQLQWTGL